MFTSKQSNCKLFPKSGYRVIDPIIPHVEGSVGASFQDKWRDRCLNENAINLAVYEANVKFLSGQELYEALNRDIPNQRGFGGMRPWNEGAVFIGEDGQPWQIRLDVLDKNKATGKAHKYTSPKNKGSQVFRPVVPTEIRVLMSKIYCVEIPLTGSFWKWFDTSDEAKKLPLVVTEGATKALSILSLGIPCISFYGVDSAFQSAKVGGDPKLLLSEFRDAAQGKDVLFAFDSDVKAKARHKVQRAIGKTGKAVALVAKSVQVLEWTSELGKGADDFIAANGGDAFFELLKNGEDFKPWNKKRSAEAKWSIWKELSARATPHITAHASTVADCNFPLPSVGECLLVSAAMGLGKTHWFGDVLKLLRRLYPDLYCDAIGHRNNLLKQTAQRLGLIHIQDVACGNLTEARLKQEPHMAFCIDSLWRRFETLIAAIDRGGKVLLILDEVDAVIKHLKTSSTLKPARRIQTINKFSTLLKAIGGGGGWVIGGEANLTALSVKAIEELSGGTLKVTVAENTQKPAPWKCFEVSVIGKDGKPKAATAANQKKATIALIDRLRSQGQRVMVLTTSQATCEAIEGIYSRRGDKCLRVDSKTSPDKDQKATLQNAGPTLATLALDIFVGSPSIECGLSVEGLGLFDAVVLYASGLEPFTAFQMLGRLRDASVPRYICCAEYAQTSGSKELDEAKILVKWGETVQGVMDAHELMAEKQGAIEVATKLAAKYHVRSNAGESCLRAALMDLLRADGHTIEPLVVKLDGSEGAVLKEAEEIRLAVRTQDWINANDLTCVNGQPLTADLAKMKLREAGLKWEDQVVCLKAIARELHGDLVDQPPWIKTYWANEFKAKRMKSALLTNSEFNNEGMAAESDFRSTKTTIGKTGTIWAPGVQGRDRKIQVLKKLNLAPLLSLVGTETLIHKEHFLVTTVFKSALMIADEVKAILGLTVTKDTQPMAFVSDLLKTKLGYSFEHQKIRISDPNEFPVHQNHLNRTIGSFGGPETLEPDNPSTSMGRPKGPKMLRVNAYKLIAAPHHREMVENFVEHHKNYKPEMQPENSPLQAGRSVVWGKTENFSGEIWTVSAVIGHAVWLSEGREVLPVNQCQKFSREVLDGQCSGLVD